MSGWAGPLLFVRFNFTLNLLFLASVLLGLAAYPAQASCCRWSLVSAGGMAAAWAIHSTITTVRAFWTP